MVAHVDITGACDSDTDLTRAAQTGDTAVLSTLLERHRASMRAVVISLLGPAPTWTTSSRTPH